MGTINSGKTLKRCDRAEEAEDSGAEEGLYSGKTDVIILTDANFQERVLDSDSLFMVDFYTSW